MIRRNTIQLTDYHIIINQTPISAVVDIALNPDGGRVSVVKLVNTAGESLTVEPAQVNFPSFSRRTPAAIDGLIAWIRQGQRLAGGLDLMLKELADFEREITVTVAADGELGVFFVYPEAIGEAVE